VCARAARDTYRTFLTRELSPSTARADDYSLELVPDCGHFIVDELPGLVRARLVELAASFPPC
jgi:pimeloyl-ACP methyl ester carboxylesterase